MKNPEVYLNETISAYNNTVNDMSKFQFNKRESELFENMIKQAQNEAYNKAIDDAVIHARAVDNKDEIDFMDDFDYWVDSNSILKLKQP